MKHASEASVWQETPTQTVAGEGCSVTTPPTTRQSSLLLMLFAGRAVRGRPRSSASIPGIVALSACLFPRLLTRTNAPPAPPFNDDGEGEGGGMQPPPLSPPAPSVLSPCIRCSRQTRASSSSCLCTCSRCTRTSSSRLCACSCCSNRRSSPASAQTRSSSAVAADAATSAAEAIPIMLESPS